MWPRGPRTSIDPGRRLSGDLRQELLQQAGGVAGALRSSHADGAGGGGGEAPLFAEDTIEKAGSPNLFRGLQGPFC